jgi:hypothetical protein
LRRGDSAPESDDQPRNTGEDRQILQWGLVSLGCAAVAVLGGGETALGINLFTAGLAASIAAATMFLRTVRDKR